LHSAKFYEVLRYM